jgi:hypothetical protein
MRTRLIRVCQYVLLSYLATALIPSASIQADTVRDADGLVFQIGTVELAKMEFPQIGNRAANCSIEDAGGGWQRVALLWQLDTQIQQDEIAANIDLQLQPDFWWAPHLAPTDSYCIAQHVFRSPVLIAEQGPLTLVTVPDLDLCGKDKSAPWFLDLDAKRNRFTIGLTRSRVEAHVLYKKMPGMTLGPGRVELAFFVRAYRDESIPRNPWAEASTFLWARYGTPLFKSGQPTTVPLDRYVEHTYRWAFDTWKDAVWQEFDLSGKRVGSPCFIVNTTQSPNYTGEVNLREDLSIWNQAWFDSLRAASGLFRYARRTKNAELLDKANMGKEFALAAPNDKGIFPSVYAAEMYEETIGGEKYRRSHGWQTGRWTNSNRVPWERGVKSTWYHVLDASNTALGMLRWYDELEKDKRLLEYAKSYGDFLLTLQDSDGFFPAWLDPDTLAPSPVLAQSPETSRSVSFLFKLAKITRDKRYEAAALRAMDGVIAFIIPGGRWEDFETYWSCCGWGRDKYVGARIPRNAMYKQCTFSMFWTAEALLDAYNATHDSRYLAWGRRTLDELSMFQQVWQPPYIHIPALGGFGVMNCDGEWNDARQSLFAELFLDYYKATGNETYRERGIAALKSSFVMMYCPENAETKALWEKVWPFFGRDDYGFMMENYGHGGETDDAGLGIGEFTIYTWGNGAAAEAYNRMLDHFGNEIAQEQTGARRSGKRH